MTKVLFLTLALTGTLAAETPKTPDTARKAEDVDACALVTRAEAAAALGGLRGEPRPDVGIQKEKECHYVSASGARLSLSVYTAERWGMQKGIVSEMNPEDVAGLGDEAFAVKRGSDTEVYVRKGKLILEVRGSAGMAASRAMAEKAAGRL